MAEIDYSKQKSGKLLGYRNLYQKIRDDKEKARLERENLELQVENQQKQKQAEEERARLESEYFQRQKVLQENKRLLQTQEYVQMARFERMLWELTKESPELREAYGNTVTAKVIKPEGED